MQNEKTIFMLITRTFESPLWELRIPHWTKQISWLASDLNLNWMPSLSLISSGLLTQDRELSSPLSFSKQTRLAWLRHKRSGEWAGGAGEVLVFVCLIWLILKFLCPFPLCPTLNHDHYDCCPFLDEVVSILVIGEMSDVSHMAVKSRCKSAHALHHTVCQVWV